MADNSKPVKNKQKPYKYYTYDLEVLSKDYKRIALMSYIGSTDKLMRRFTYGQSQNLIKSTLVLGSKNSDDYDLAIVVTDVPWSDLPDYLKKVKNGIYYKQEQADRSVYSQENLNQTDWLVLRELERKFLNNTELFKSRENWRKEVDKEIREKIIST